MKFMCLLHKRGLELRSCLGTLCAENSFQRSPSSSRKFIAEESVETVRGTMRLVSLLRHSFFFFCTETSFHQSHNIFRCPLKAPFDKKLHFGKWSTSRHTDMVCMVEKNTAVCHVCRPAFLVWFRLVRISVSLCSKPSNVVPFFSFLVLFQTRPLFLFCLVSLFHCARSKRDEPFQESAERVSPLFFSDPVQKQNERDTITPPILPAIYYLPHLSSREPFHFYIPSLWPSFIFKLFVCLSVPISPHFRCNLEQYAK